MKKTNQQPPKQKQTSKKSNANPTQHNPKTFLSLLLSSQSVGKRERGRRRGRGRGVKFVVGIKSFFECSRPGWLSLIERDTFNYANSHNPPIDPEVNMCICRSCVLNSFNHILLINKHTNSNITSRSQLSSCILFSTT